MRWPRRGTVADSLRIDRYEAGFSRREILAGGIGVGALLALPDLSGRSGTRPVPSSKATSRFAFVYGTPASGAAPSGSLAAASCPVPHTASSPEAVPVASGLASAPVSSHDKALMAVASVDTVPDGAKVTLTLLDCTSAAVARQGSVTLTGVPHDAHILVTPVFAAGSAIVPVVLAITVPVARRLVSSGIPVPDARPPDGRPPGGHIMRSLISIRTAGPLRDRSICPTIRFWRCRPRSPTAQISCSGQRVSRSQATRPRSGPGHRCPG